MLQRALGSLEDMMDRVLTSVLEVMMLDSLVQRALGSLED